MDKHKNAREQHSDLWITISKCCIIALRVLEEERSGSELSTSHLCGTRQLEDTRVPHCRYSGSCCVAKGKNLNYLQENPWVVAEWEDLKIKYTGQPKLSLILRDQKSCSNKKDIQNTASLSIQQKESNGEAYFILNAQVSVAQSGKHLQMKGQSCKPAWRNTFLSCKVGTKRRAPDRSLTLLHVPKYIHVKCPQGL